MKVNQRRITEFIHTDSRRNSWEKPFTMKVSLWDNQSVRFSIISSLRLNLTCFFHPPISYPRRAALRTPGEQPKTMPVSHNSPERFFIPTLSSSRRVPTTPREPDVVSLSPRTTSSLSLSFCFGVPLLRPAWGSGMKWNSIEKLKSEACYEETPDKLLVSWEFGHLVVHSKHWLHHLFIKERLLQVIPSLKVVQGFPWLPYSADSGRM